MTDDARPAMTLKSSEFRKGREASWRELEGLIARIERGKVAALSADEVERLPILYRSAVSSLSVARSIALDRNLLIYLENLALRAFLVVYGPRTKLLDGALDFLRRGFPAAVRSARWHILIASLCLLIGVIAGFVMTVTDEVWFGSFVADGMAQGRGPDSTAAELRDEEIFRPWPGPAESFALMANYLFQHNTLVGVLMFSLGIAAGVPTLLLLLYQGLMLGAFLALHYDRGLAVDFLGWVSIHGVTELSAIILCAAGGLVIAEKMLFPGRYSRIESLALHGRQAAQLAIGAALMFLIAGILEGGFRQLIQSTDWRFAIGATTGLLWLSYFTRAGRRSF